MAASAQNLLLKGSRAVAGPWRRFCARSKESSVFAKFLHHFRESLERTTTKDMFLGHSGRSS